MYHYDFKKLSKNIIIQNIKLFVYQIYYLSIFLRFLSICELKLSQIKYYNTIFIGNIVSITILIFMFGKSKKKRLKINTNTGKSNLK